MTKFAYLSNVKPNAIVILEKGGIPTLYLGANENGDVFHCRSEVLYNDRPVEIVEGDFVVTESEFAYLSELPAGNKVRFYQHGPVRTYTGRPYGLYTFKESASTQVNRAVEVLPRVSNRIVEVLPTSKVMLSELNVNEEYLSPGKQVCRFLGRACTSTEAVLYAYSLKDGHLVYLSLNTEVERIPSDD